MIPRIVFVSGLSGAGKSQTLNILEDYGYFCVDNLPPLLIPRFSELILGSPEEFPRVAIGVNVRERDFLEDFQDAFDRLQGGGHQAELVFLEAADDVLLRRFSETRRPHPLSLLAGLPLLESIQRERTALSRLRERADRIVNSSLTTPAQLKIALGKIYGEESPASGGLTLYLLSFGFKYGIPMDSDMVFDVRFLPNPNYDPVLRNRTGLDPDIWTLLGPAGAAAFVDSLGGFLGGILPCYAEERRASLTISIGCTGGRHRSVAIVEHLGMILGGKGYRLHVAHRDIENEDRRYRAQDGRKEDRKP